jgi:outer membrane protein TolC
VRPPPRPGRVRSATAGSSQPAYGATASLNLWAAGAIQAQVAQQKALFVSGRGALAQACSDALQQASDAYVAVLRADAHVALWREHLAEYQSIESMVSQIAEVDRGRRVDVDQVITRKGLVQLSLADAQSQTRQTRLNLARAAGQGMEPEATGVAGLSARLQALPLEEAQTATRAWSPALAAARSEVDAARHAVDMTRGSRWPQVNLVLQSQRDRSTGQRLSDATVGVQAQWSVFNGGADVHAERASLEAVLAAQARVEEVDRALGFAVAQAWEAAQTAQSRADLQAQQERPAAAVLAANRELFRLGRRSVLDILNAANDVHAVKLARVDARHESWVQRLRLHTLTGHLMAQLALSPPALCARESLMLPDAPLGDLPGF